MIESKAIREIRTILAERINLNSRERSPALFQERMIRDLRNIRANGPLVVWANGIQDDGISVKYLKSGWDELVRFSLGSLNHDTLDTLENYRLNDVDSFDNTRFHDVTALWEKMNLSRFKAYVFFILWNQRRLERLEVLRNMDSSQYQKEMRRIREKYIPENEKRAKSLRTELFANQRRIIPAITQLRNYQRIVNELLQSRNALVSEMQTLDSGFTDPIQLEVNSLLTHDEYTRSSDDSTSNIPEKASTAFEMAKSVHS